MKMIGIGTLTSSPPSKINLEEFPPRKFRCGTELFPCVPWKTFHHFKFLRLDSAQNRILKPIPLRSSSSKDSQVIYTFLSVFRFVCILCNFYLLCLRRRFRFVHTFFIGKRRSCRHRRSYEKGSCKVPVAERVCLW